MNDVQYDRTRHHVISMASCTTNSLAPVAKVLQEQFGIVHLFITTVHAYTASQSILDKPTRHRRRGRAGALSMIPTTTGAAKATALVIPELAGKMDGMAIRVPVPDGSVTDIVAELATSTSVDEINACLRDAAQRPPMQGILAVSDDLGHAAEAVAIAVIALFSVVLGFIQERRAERALEALRRMAAPHATVMRDGEADEVPSRDLVPGDIIRAGSGRYRTRRCAPA